MQSEENFIIFSDVKRVFIRSKWLIASLAIFFGCLGVYVRSQCPITYKVEATFKESEVKATFPGESMLESMVRSVGIVGKNKGGYIITSALMLRPVIETLGMQASIASERGWRHRIDQLQDALLVERGRIRYPQEKFTFENVSYDGEMVHQYEILFTSKESFEIRDQQSQILEKGVVGEPLNLGAVTWTLKEVPKSLKLGHSYSLSFSPIHGYLVQLKDGIEVEAAMGDHSLINLTLECTDRLWGKQVLNTLMGVYQNYLLEENRRVSKGQIAYLARRRDEVCRQMDSFLEKHVDYLKESLGETGFLTLGQRLPFMQERKNNLSAELLGLKIESENLFQATSSSAFRLDSEMTGLQRELHCLNKERDELGLALMEKDHHSLTKHMVKLEALDLEEVRINTGVDHFFSHLFKGLNQNKRKRDDMLIAASEFGQILSPDAHQLVSIQKEKQRVLTLSQEKEHGELPVAFLNNRLRLLSMQEEVFKQRIFHRTEIADEFAGVDIGTLKKLLLNHLNERDSRLTAISQLKFVKSQMEQESIEWVSLGSFLPDTLSKEIATEIGKIVQETRKKGNFTEKELERKERVVFQKKEDLKKHMDQTAHLEHLKIALVNDQIGRLQTAILDMLNQEISLTEQQIKDRVQDRLFQVSQEREVLQGQVKEIVNEMERVPETWLQERQLQFSFDMNKSMVESLVRLVETKNIESNLATIESQPLDYAYASLTPKHPKLILIGCLGMFLGTFLGMGVSFARAFHQGIPLTLENLMARGKKVLGRFSPTVSKIKNTEDIEVLRSLSLLLKETEHPSVVVTLVLGEGVDYSASLAELLAKEDKNILLVHLDFSAKKSSKKLPGLAAYLEGEVEEPTLHKKPYGALMSMGRETPFGDELLKNQKFQDFIDHMRHDYDVILLALPKKAKDSLPKSFFALSDVMILSLATESFSQLTPYFKWGDEEGTIGFLS